MNRTAGRRVESLHECGKSTIEQQVVCVEEDDIGRAHTLHARVARGTGRSAINETHELGALERRQRHLRGVIDDDQLDRHALAAHAGHGLDELRSGIRGPGRDDDADPGISHQARSASRSLVGPRTLRGSRWPRASMRRPPRRGWRAQRLS